jgi:hypothetical protein
MELVMLWRILALHRVALAVGAVCALVAALAGMGVLPVGHGGGATETDVARARLLIDTRHSLVDDLRARADTIGAQAALLTDLLAAETQRAQIARASRIDPGSLLVLRPQVTAPTKPSTLAERDATLNGVGRVALTVQTSELLPIVSLEASAPSGPLAVRVVAAGTASLRSLATARAGRPSHALRVTQLGPVRQTVVRSGGARRVVLGLVGGILAFALWCGGILVLERARGWRADPTLEPSY